MATRNEKDTTRARANALREFLTMNTKENPFDHPEIYEAMDLCLSCKGCKSECPSNVDMATLKAEAKLYTTKRPTAAPPVRSRVFGNDDGSIKNCQHRMPALSNAVLSRSVVVGGQKELGGTRALLPPEGLSLRSW